MSFCLLILVFFLSIFFFTFLCWNECLCLLLLHHLVFFSIINSLICHQMHLHVCRAWNAYDWMAIPSIVIVVFTHCGATINSIPNENSSPLPWLVRRQQHCIVMDLRVYRNIIFIAVSDSIKTRYICVCVSMVNIHIYKLLLLL